MTVCIAALADNGDSCVLVSDKMTTAHFPLGYEFESDVEKIVNITDSIYALISGDVLLAHEIIQTTKSKITGIGNVSHIVEIIRHTYQEVRRARIIRTELEPRGLDLNAFYQNQQRLDRAIVQTIDQALRNLNLGVEFLISGKDGSGCHIYTVQNPGVSINNDPIGFSTIGSGGPHAVYYIIESKYTKGASNQDVEELLNKAKTRAEVAPGVGKGTYKVTIKKD